MPHEKKDRTISVNGRTMKESAARDILNDTIDPESMNYLLARQRIKLQPSTLEIVGQSVRYPVIEELEDAVGKICPFCGEEISQSEASWKDIGNIVRYSQDYWHWEHLALQVLLLEHGHANAAAMKYNLDPVELRTMKLYFRSLPWGRLGYLRENERPYITNEEGQ